MESEGGVGISSHAKKELDPFAVWKVYFPDGAGTAQDPFTVPLGVHIKDILRDAAFLTMYWPDRTVCLKFHDSILSLNNQLELTAIGPDGPAVVSLAQKLIKELVQKENLKESITPMSPEDFRAFQEELKDHIAHRGFLGKIKKIASFFKKSTDHK